VPHGKYAYGTPRPVTKIVLHFSDIFRRTEYPLLGAATVACFPQESRIVCKISFCHAKEGPYIFNAKLQ
jgi:hypothetical protein